MQIFLYKSHILKYLGYILLAFFSSQAQAFSWSSLWQSKNQQAKQMLKENKFQQAQHTFTDSNWKAVAAYRASDYQAALDLLAKSKDKDANYNLGNTLAKLGKYEQAIVAYEKAIDANKNHKDAIFNKKLVSKLLKQQKQQQQKEPQKQPGQDNQKQQNQGDKGNPNNQNNPDKEPPQNGEDNKNKQPEQKEKDKAEAKPKTADEKQNKPTSPTTKEDQTAGSKQQMKEQWLKLIPDDPGGLLREKFKRDYLRRRGELS